MTSERLRRKRLAPSMAILVVLLLIRNLHGPIAVWLWQATPPTYEQIPYWYERGSLLLTYLLLFLALYENAGSLMSWNADGPYLWLVVLVGALLVPFLVGGFLGFMIAIVSALTLRRILRGEMHFGDPKPDYRRAIGVTLLGFAPALALLLLVLWAGHRSAAFANIPYAVALAGLPNVVAEEAMYRGLPWMILRRLGINDLLAFCIQAVAFWLSHTNYWQDPVMFWFWLPWAAVWLGLIVWRSKSLAMSTVAHFAFNLSAVFFKW